ncbi:MAG: cohesin domain-containing protein [Candidatus Uhrbacteria bacterium]|nr:cohesin domain-containing protein [Candidatus Uhrbacteria bacterium]
MLKQILQSFLMAVVVLAPNLSVHAAGTATMSLDAESYEVTRAELFDVTVSVDPKGEFLDTVRAVVTFDPSVVNVQSVRLAGSFDRVAPGNYLDNGSGKVSWGAFTLEGPVTASTPLITVTFLAIAQGEGEIKISSDSRAISNGEEKINIAQLGSSTVTVAQAQEAESGVALLAIESSTHPDQSAWYSDRSVDLSWTQLEGDTPVEAYYYSFGPESDAEPSISLDGSTTELSLEAPQDGLYYFRLKGVHEDGRETPVAQRRVGVDITAPNAIELTVQDNKILVGESAWFTFATTDETSGILQYQVTINDSEFQVQTSPLEIEDLPEGTYFFRVAAFDRAGNVIYSGVSVRVYPQGTDLSRAEGYEQSSEVQAITTSLQTTSTQISDNKALLITVVLGIAALIGIIYVSRKRKR